MCHEERKAGIARLHGHACAAKSSMGGTREQRAAAAPHASPVGKQRNRRGKAICTQSQCRRCGKRQRQRCARACRCVWPRCRCGPDCKGDRPDKHRHEHSEAQGSSKLLLFRNPTGSPCGSISRMAQDKVDSQEPKFLTGLRTCTRVRLAQMQVWPALRRPEATTACAAASMSASGNTRNGALPPAKLAAAGILLRSHVLAIHQHTCVEALVQHATRHFPALALVQPLLFRSHCTRSGAAAKTSPGPHT